MMNPLAQENPLYFINEGATFAVDDDDDKAPLRDNMVVNVNGSMHMDRKPPPATTAPKQENDYEELPKI